MSSNFREPKSLPKTRTKTYISPLVWRIFVASGVLFLSSAFLTTWTSTGPTFWLGDSSNSQSIETSSR